jgi:hypothetical protein
MTSYYFIPNLFYIPRGSFFGDNLIKNMLLLATIYIGIMAFSYIFMRIKEDYDDREKNTLRLGG